ncbi:hypothetical protein C1H46_000184 [Malus baccata]|uniref:Uncharacterized protein n=1 Tax=Malus baccata TaxID=106549 RepID=A0A540NTH8_MALBA|nr:hypothetical protein C1H46_000184 [Malus baccata]
MICSSSSTPLVAFSQPRLPIMDTVSGSLDEKEQIPLKRKKRITHLAPIIFKTPALVSLVGGAHISPLLFLKPAQQPPPKSKLKPLPSSISSLQSAKPIEDLCRIVILSSTTLTRFEGTSQPYLVIRPLVDHVAFPTDASSFQNVDYTMVILGATIALMDYKKVHSHL